MVFSAGELAHHLGQVAPQQLGRGHGEIPGRAHLSANDGGPVAVKPDGALGWGKKVSDFEDMVEICQKDNSKS